MKLVWELKNEILGSDNIETLRSAGNYAGCLLNTGQKKEPMKYTGTLVKGIATMHKSNAVPIISQEEATDIARMRRA